MQNIEAQVEALLVDPITASRYISLFDREIKEHCVRKSEFFARCLVSDSNPEIRMLCASLYESLALNLIEDTSSLVRKTCAEHWESCAKYLFADEDYDVRHETINWEACHPLILLSEAELESDILQMVALTCLHSTQEDQKEKARQVLEEKISYDEDFATSCIELEDTWILQKCAESWRSCALRLVHSEDDELVEISIQRLLEDNDWYCLGSEELVDLCHIDERLAEVILDNNLDDWWVKAACVQLYESCAIQLMTDEEDVIAEHAKFVILESNNQELKLKAIQSPYDNYHIAAVLISDKDPEVRKACIEVDEDFASELVTDNDMSVRLACLEAIGCVDELVNDHEVEVHKACARYYEGAVQLMKDEDPEVRQICAEHYQCALELINDIDDKVRAIANITVESNQNLTLPFDEE